MSKLGRGIDKLDSDLLQSGSLGLWEETLSQCNDSLLGSWASSLDHHIVLIDDTIVWESTHWSNVLLSDIKGGGGLVGVLSLDTDAINLLVHLGTVVHTHGSGTGNGPGDSGWMPCSDTGNLAETAMGLTWETGNSPSGDDTLGTTSLGDGNGINHLVQREDAGYWDWLLQETSSKVNLVSNRSSIDLDLHKMGLLLVEWGLGDLSMGNNTDHVAVLLHLLKLGLDFLSSIGMLGNILGEGLLLGLVPVLVEATLDLLGQMLSPHGGQSTWSTSGLDVSNDTDDNHWWGLNNGNGLGNLLLVGLGSWLVDITGDVSHSGLVSHKGSEMWLGGSVVAWEGLYLSLAALAALLWHESQRTQTWVLKLHRCMVIGVLVMLFYLVVEEVN